NAHPGKDTIVFDLTGVIINLTSALPNLADDVDIQGPASAKQGIESGFTEHKYFTVNSGVTASISSLSITGPTGSSGGLLFNNGGTVTISNCNLSSTDVAGQGGAIYNDTGTLTISECNVSASGLNNTSGGAIYNYRGTVTLSDSHVSGSATGTGGTGGAISNG